MTALQLGFVVLVLAAVAIYFAPQLVQWRKQIKEQVQPIVPISSDSEAKVRRLMRLIDLIKELESVGAKSAASKLKAAASTLIDEDFLA